MKLHEYQAKKILKTFGIKVPYRIMELLPRWKKQKY